VPHRIIVGTLAVDGWAVTFGTARRGLGGLQPRPVQFKQRSRDRHHTRFGWSVALRF